MTTCPNCKAQLKTDHPDYIKHMFDLDDKYSVKIIMCMLCGNKFKLILKTREG